MRFWWEETFSGIGDVAVQVEAVRDVGDSVLLRVRLQGHGTSGRVPFNQTIWTVLEWSEAKLLHWTSHLREADALAAVGLRE